MSLYKRGLEKVSETSVPVIKDMGTPQKETLSSPSLKTAIDRFYHLIELSPSGIALQKVLDILDVRSPEIEDWAKILEKQGLIEVVYAPTGGTFYRLKDKGVVPKHVFFDFKALSHRKILSIVFVFLFLVALGMTYYFYSEQIISFFSSLSFGGGS